MATEDSTKYEWQRHGFKERFVRFALYFGFVAFLVALWQGMDISIEYFPSAPAELYDLFQRMYPPDWSYAPEIVGPTIETIHMGVLGTAISVVFSIPVIYLAAENLTPNRITYAIGKFIVSFSRTVDSIIYALIFVLLFGPGALAGMFAVGIHSLGFIAKVLSEEVEEIDRGQVEAIKATGAGSLNQILYSIVPQVKAPFIGVTVYRWDVNVRSATVLGLVGAGGIGVELEAKMGLLYWHQVLTILVAILAIVVFSEAVSAYFRAKVR